MNDRTLGGRNAAQKGGITMPDRVKVIEGLEMSYGYSNVDEDNMLVPQQLVLDTLALLKAQEPRVMTLEETLCADYCWYESRTANVCVLCSAHMATNRNGKPKTEFEQMGSPIRGFQYDETYGKDWRCWTARPTDEQREATPWN